MPLGQPWAVAVGQIDAEVGQKVSGLIRTFLTALDKAEMEGQIRELQATVKKLKEGDAL